MKELEIMERINNHSVKWDQKVFLERFSYQGDKPYPLYVADMDFKMAKEIKEKMFELLNEPDFGYPSDFDDFIDAIKYWYKEVHNLDLDCEILPCLGTVVGVNVITSLYAKGGVLVNTPIYGQFSYSMNFGEAVTVPLIIDNKRYYYDYEKIEEEIIAKRVDVIIICNPHNPSGRNWSYQELERIVSLAKKYDCVLISDEIHADIDLKNNFVSLVNFFNDYEKLVVSSAANKTFSISGLRTSFLLSPSKEIIANVKEYFTNYHFEVNRFGTSMTSICYYKGLEWLSNLKYTINLNLTILKDMLSELDLEIMEPDASYLVWVKLNKVSDVEKFVTSLAINTGVMLEVGSRFIKDYANYVRINLATSSQNIKEALELFKDFYLEYQE